jgi:hypothetical protein
MKKFSRPRMNTRKYKESFAIINGEGERTHGATWWPATSRVGAPGMWPAAVPRASLPPFPRQGASRRPLSPTSPKATVWPPWYSPPATATSEDRPQPRLARRDVLVVRAPRRMGACACGSEGRSGRWCVRRAAAGGDKPARVSNWAHRFHDSTIWNRERRRVGVPWG